MKIVSFAAALLLATGIGAAADDDKNNPFKAKGAADGEVHLDGKQRDNLANFSAQLGDVSGFDLPNVDDTQATMSSSGKKFVELVADYLRYERNLEAAGFRLIEKAGHMDMDAGHYQAAQTAGTDNSQAIVVNAVLMLSSALEIMARDKQLNRLTISQRAIMFKKAQALYFLLTKLNVLPKNT